MLLTVPDVYFWFYKDISSLGLYIQFKVNRDSLP